MIGEMAYVKKSTEHLAQPIRGWGFGFWVLGFEFWVLSLGFWVLSLGFWGFGFWVWVLRVSWLRASFILCGVRIVEL